MNQLTMQMDYFHRFDTEFETYISALDGVDQVEQKPNGIHITYDPNKISIHRILLEIKLFLGLLKTPSLIGFDKHFQKASGQTSVMIEDACCEYCVKSVVEDLILIDGIEKVSVAFQDDTFFQVSIQVMYDSNLFYDKKVKELVEKLFPD